MKFFTATEDPMAALFADPMFREAYLDARYAEYDASVQDDGCNELDEPFEPEGITLDIGDFENPNPPGMGLEDLVRYGRVASARQDQWFHDLLTDAAVNPSPWVGPDPTLDPAWTPPRDMTIAAVRARRRDVAVRATAMDIALRTHLSEHQVRSRAHRAQTLIARCPRLWAAYLAGDVSEQNAGTGATLAASLPADCPEAWAAFDDAAVEPASRLTPGKFRTRARAIRERVHPESVDERHARAAKDRGVWVTPQLDGMGTVEALVTATSAHAIDEYLDAQARHLAAQPGETRTLAQLRADIFTDLLLNGGLPADTATGNDAEAGIASAQSDPTNTGAAGPENGDDGTDINGAVADADAPSSTLPSLKGISATVRITIPALTLLGQSDEPATLDGYGPIDIDTARHLAGNAKSWIRVLTHPVTGTVLDVDRKMYKVPADLRRLLETRHPTCVAPGCSRPARRCDIDHRKRWADGGTTDADNLCPLCEHHHVIKDETLWTLVRDPGTGTLVWVSPTGYITDADPPPF